MTRLTKDAVVAAAASVQGILSVAAGLAGGGRQVDLTGLERDMSVLCNAAMLLPEAEGRAVRPALIGVLAQLDGLIAQFRRA